MSSDAALTFAVVFLAATCGAVGLRVIAALRLRRRDAQICELLATFGPIAERAQSDPRVLLAWYRAAEAARRIFPEACAALDGGATDRFPFGAAQLEAAHARWTADWLEWERHQEAEYRRKSEVIEAELDRSEGAASASPRARLETLEQQRLEQYQRWYEEYVRISRALAKLTDTTSRT